MVITIQPWDYAMFLAFSVLLLINVVGIAKYAMRSEVLTLFIMIVSFLAIGCKYLSLINDSPFCSILDRESLFIYLY